jgi:hypothetical protein
MATNFPFFRLAGKRQFKTDEQETQLVPVVAPSGKACLGTESEIEIVEQPCSEADPPVYLDVEAPDFAPLLEILATKDPIRGDGKDSTTIRVKLLPSKPGGTLDALKEWGVVWRPLRAKRADGKGGEGDWPLVKIAPCATAEAEFAAEWAQEDGTIEIGIDASYYLKAIEDGRPPFEAKGTATVSVIGCNPLLVLQAMPEYADADGETEVVVRPTLIMFGAPYEKPMEIRDLDFESEFLEQKPKNQDVPTAEAMHDIRFRCKFRLDDETMKRHSEADGTKVTMKVKPFDSYAKGVPATGLAADTPATIHLAPSTIQFSGPVPDALPDESLLDFGPPKPSTFRTKISARVVSYNGRPVNGEVIARDSRGGSFTGEATFWQGWGFNVSYVPPATPEWRVRKESPPRSAFVPSRNRSDRIKVARDGCIWFFNEAEGKQTDYLLYDHWQTFYSESEKYLFGQASTVSLEFQAGLLKFTPLKLTVGTVPGLANVQVKVVSQCGKELKDAKVTLKAGSVQEEKQTDPYGLAEFKQLDSTAGQAEIVVERKGEPLLIGVGQDPPKANKGGVDLIEGQKTEVKIEMEVSTQWALTTLGSLSWGVGNIPLIGKLAGKMAPVGITTVFAVITNLGIHDPAKIGGPYFENQPGRYGSKNTYFVAFSGVGVTPSLNLLELIKALYNAPRELLALRSALGDTLRSIYQANSAQSLSTIGQAWDFFKQSTKVKGFYDGMTRLGISKCVPGPTDFTTDVPIRVADFNGPGSIEQAEGTVVRYAQSFGYGHFAAVPYTVPDQTLPGIYIGSPGMTGVLPAISLGFWVGAWYVPGG